MRKNRTVTIVLAALSLLNYVVGGLMGFILIRGEHKGVFAFIYFVFLVASAISMAANWYMLRQANAETPYRVLKLRKWRLVRESRHMKPDRDGLKALAMGITGYAFSLGVPLYACALIWPDTFWMLSFNTIFSVLILLSVLVDFIIEIVIATRERKKGETL